MKIKAQDLEDTLALAIAGDEPWLTQIYDDFPTPAAATKPRITGTLRLVKEAGTVVVSGEIAFAPMLPCSRCTAAIQWPLSLAISVRYLPETFSETKKDLTLSRHDLDAYYIENGLIDLEGLINDAIQTAIPSQVLAEDEATHQCRVCHQDLGGGRLYGQDDGVPHAGGAANPFAVLKTLKLKN